MAIPKISNSFHPSFNHSVHFEIRLFYVRISPCVPETVPDHLTLRHLHRELGVSLVINGLRVPELNPANVTLKRDRLDKDSLEVTYVSTDSVRITGGVEFEVLEKKDVILCGSLERMDDNWANGVVGLDNDSGTGTGSGWSMDCYVANLMGSADSSSAFFQPKLGVSSPSIEVYIAGCCAGVPLILTKTIQLSPRRKVSKQSMLNAIPEDEEIGKGQKIGSELFCRRSSQSIEQECYDYEDSDGKFGGRSFYPEEMYNNSNGGEDGELSWFNAGVRVGVGIGLGMCVGVGIGVGLLMRSYQATTRNFRRRFF